MVVLGIILLLYGLCKAFFGYKLYKISLFFAGVLIGVGIGIIACRGVITTVVVSILLGILCGILSVVLMRVGIFLQCFIYGVLAIMIPTIVSTLIGLANVEGLISVGVSLIQTGRTGIDFTSSLPLALVVGLLAGVLGVIFTRILLIVSTALIGGLVSGVGICLLILQMNVVVVGITGLTIMILGIVIQPKTNKKKDKKNTINEEKRYETVG